MVQLTPKETSFLKDMKEQEQLCVDKYGKYASTAHDGQLKNLFTQLGQTEQQHLDTVTQIMSGTAPSAQSGGGAQKQLSFTATYKAGDTSPERQADCYICSDLLSTEKYVSTAYNSCIFEIKDTNMRDALNHIQKEEQGHGEQIYNYMAQNGMYN